jgi:hypothetical protein
MGWSFHKSVNLGPFRLSIGKSGVGFSMGTSGFRIGRKADGTTYTSAGLPGTGLRYQKTFRK